MTDTQHEAAERVSEIRRKVREEVLRSANILRPEELALTVDDVLERALRAHDAGQAGVVVKPLEWGDATKGPGCPIRFQAWPLPGYRIFLYQWGEADQWAVEFGSVRGGTMLPKRGDADAAKAAVEAEYQRIVASKVAVADHQGPIAYAVLDMSGEAFHSIHETKGEAEQAARFLGTVVRVTRTPGETP